MPTTNAWLQKAFNRTYSIFRLDGVDDCTFALSTSAAQLSACQAFSRAASRPSRSASLAELLRSCGCRTSRVTRSLRADPDGKAEREFRYGLWEANTKSFKNAPKHFEKAPADRRATHLQRQPIGRRLNFNATIINAPLARARRQSSGARPEDRRGRGCVDKGRR